MNGSRIILLLALLLTAFAPIGAKERAYVAQLADTTSAEISADTTGFFYTRERTNMSTLDKRKYKREQRALAASEGRYCPDNCKVMFALKTNLLFDALSMLNAEVEIPIGRRFSVLFEDVFPWWEYGNKYCLQMWEMGPEIRYWFDPRKGRRPDKLEGFFIGAYGMSSKFDFQYDTKIDYQGEFWSAGISAGFAKRIGKKQRNRLEFSIAGGYLLADYRHYLPTDSYDMLIRDKYNTGKFSYGGPLKAKISYVVPVYTKNKNTGK